MNRVAKRTKARPAPGKRVSKDAYRSVRGWLSDAEAAELQRLAEGKRVLEVGSYCGRSTIAMAATAKNVTAVDNWSLMPARVTERLDGPESGPSPNPYAEFVQNLHRCHAEKRVTIQRGALETVIPTLDLTQFDLVFYDADHSYESTLNGGTLILEKGIRQDATLTFHDCDAGDPGVVAAVQKLSRRLNQRFRMVDSLAVFDATRPDAQSAPLPQERYKVALAFPYCGKITFEAARGLFRASAAHDVSIHQSESSALAHNFNILFAAALNMARTGGCTHFAMLHSDIDPEDCWIDVLLSEMDRLDADLISAVSPIKDARGVTSTGIGQPGMSWSPYRRFTVRELLALPETFSSADLGYPDKCLLHNTGCWIADLRKLIFRTSSVQEDGTLAAWFAVRDRIVFDGAEYRAQFESEDWFFSRRLHELGAKTFVTRKLKLGHVGKCHFVNYQPWGNFAHDQDTEKYWSGNGHGVIEALVPKEPQPTEASAT